MKNNKVVYIHRKKSDDTIFYVGMGNPDRPKSKERSVVWKRTVNKHDYYIEVLFEGLSSEEAFDIEIYLISKLGRRDKNLGSLVNLTDGGEGVNGSDNNRGRPVYNIETGELFSSIKEGVIGSNISVYQSSHICDQLNKKIPIAYNNPLRLLEDPYPENDRLWKSIRQNEVPFEEGFDCVDDRESVAEFTSVEQNALDRLSTLPKTTLDAILMVEDTSLRKTAKHYNLGVSGLYNAIKSIKDELLGNTKNWKYSTKLVPNSFYIKPDKPKKKKVKINKPKVKKVKVEKVKVEKPKIEKVKYNIELYEKRITSMDKIKEAVRLYNESASITPSSGLHEQK